MIGRIVCAIAALAGAPALAAGWTARAVMDGPVDGDFDASGPDAQLIPQKSGEMMFTAYVFRAEGVADDTPCEQIDTFKFDVKFGRNYEMEYQLLFDVTRAGPNAYEASDLWLYYSAGTENAPMMVDILGDIDPRVTVTDLSCSSDGSIALTFDFGFSGGAGDGKGPQQISVEGAAAFEGALIDNFSAY